MSVKPPKSTTPTCPACGQEKTQLPSGTWICPEVKRQQEQRGMDPRAQQPL